MTNKGLFLFKTLLVVTIALLASSCLKEDGPGDTTVPVIESFTFEANDLITSAPVITDKNDSEGEIIFRVAAGTTADQLRFTPGITIPKICVVAPLSGEEQNFAVAEVKYVVANPNTGKTKTYIVKCIVDKYEDAAITSITIDETSFDKDKLLSPPTLVDGAYEFRVAASTTQDELKAIVPIMELSTGSIVSPASGVAQDFSDGKKVTYTVTAENGTEKNTYDLICVRDKYTESLMLSASSSDPLVVVKPVVGGNNIVIYVLTSATAEQIAAIQLDCVLSTGATIQTSPLVLDTPVEYVVTAEDGAAKKIYNVTAKNKIVYSFEEWSKQGATKTEHEFPTGWDSTNPGVGMIRLMYALTYSGDFAMYPTPGYLGTGVRIQTLNTNGKAKGMFTPAIPKITSGSLFLGTFETDMKNTLKSTKFGKGNDVSYKPLSVKGYYKFTPGTEFYRSTVAMPNAAAVEAVTTDKFAVTAVLYEVTSPAEELYLDGTDLTTSDRIVAIKQFQSSETIDAFTQFTLELEYIKTYDPTKFYRFSIVLSSSANGDSFSGAPGSTVIVDEIEVIYE